MRTIEVKLFARARDLAGRASLQVEVSEAATVADLRSKIAENCRALAGLLARSALAVNDEFAEDGQQLPDDAVVALLPPVSGGNDSASDAPHVRVRPPLL